MKRHTRLHFADIATSLRSSISDIVIKGVPSDAKQIYRGARNTLYDLTTDGERLCIKHFRKAKFPNCYIYTTLRQSKAERSFSHALRLLEMGFLTPKPIAFGENKTGPRLRDSFYFCEFLPFDNIRGWAERPDADKMIKAIAGEMARLHRAGIWNKDFSPGNMLCERVGEEYRFYHVDLNRMEFNVTSRKKLMTMFRSIALDAADTTRLARAYAEEMGEDPAKVEAEALASLKSYLATKRRHRALKRLIHPSRK